MSKLGLRIIQNLPVTFTILGSFENQSSDKQFLISNLVIPDFLLK